MEWGEERARKHGSGGSSAGCREPENIDLGAAVLGGESQKTDQEAAVLGDFQMPLPGALLLSIRNRVLLCCPSWSTVA